MHPKYTITPEIIERFWRKADRSGGPDACWLWQKAQGKRGYGAVNIEGQMELAHRIAYLIANGTLPDDLLVCHACDTHYPPGDTTYRRCVNPRHLWLGSHQDNVDDMYQKGRDADTPLLRGTENPRAKLTEDDVRAIRSAYAGGVSRRVIAAAHGISYQNVWLIATRRAWSHVD